MKDNFDRYQTAVNISNNLFFPKRNIYKEKGFNLRYIIFRVLRPLYKFYYKIFKLKFPISPWTSQASIIIFNQLLNKEMIGLEYGSGKSTLYFASKLKHLISIEHDKSWYDKIKELLSKKNLQNIDYRLVLKSSHHSPESTSHLLKEKLGMPKFHLRREYETYYNLVNEFPDGYFDFILIDGRARVECTLNAIDKLKSKGILVLDNSERKRYEPIMKILKSWDRLETTTGLTNTTIWFKP